MKKITTMIICVLIAISALFVMNDNQIFAANLLDTFTQGDFTYQITEVATTSHGKVKITDYDETSNTTHLTIPNTVSYDGQTYDVVSATDTAFDEAGKIEKLHIPKNLTSYNATMSSGFISVDSNNFTMKTNLKTITVDENNPTLKVIDGVLYDMTNGQEHLALYPWASNMTHYNVPEFLYTSAHPQAFTGIVAAFDLCLNLESIEMSHESNEGYFTDKGIMYSWIDKNDHTKNSEIIKIPMAMKHPVFAKHLGTDLSYVIGSMYYMWNQALDFTFEDETNFHSVDGCIYEGNKLRLYPGGRTESIYKISEGTEEINGDIIPFLGNNNLKSIVLPTSVNSITELAFLSKSLKSLKIEGSTQINWHANSLNNLSGMKMNIHVYVENGNTTVKQQMQAVFSHLTDEYFHELGAVPTATVTEVKTSLENKKDVKVTWNSDQSHTNYEVRRYDVNGKYDVVGSTTDTAIIDKTTAYDSTYQYEVIPYSLPVTSSQDSEDPLSAYHTFGTASAKSEIKTPVETFQGIYVYKDADGKEVSITKTVEVGQSAVSQAPTIPTVTGYTFDKWTSDLTNIEVVDKDFTATATYKKLDDTQTPNNPSSPEKPGDDDKPTITEKPDVDVTPEKPSDSGYNQSSKKEETVITSDQTDIRELAIIGLISLLSIVVIVRERKKDRLNHH